MPNRKKNAPSCDNTNGASKKKYHQNYTPSFPTKQDRNFQATIQTWIILNVGLIMVLAAVFGMAVMA